MYTLKTNCNFPRRCNHKFQSTSATTGPSCDTDVSSTLSCASLGSWSCLRSLFRKALYLILSALLCLGNLRLSPSNVNDPVRFGTKCTASMKSTNWWTFPFPFLFNLKEYQLQFVLMRTSAHRMDYRNHRLTSTSTSVSFVSCENTWDTRISLHGRKLVWFVQIELTTAIQCAKESLLSVILVFKWKHTNQSLYFTLILSCYYYY